jgi:hypothetical protein
MFSVRLLQGIHGTVQPAAISALCRGATRLGRYPVDNELQIPVPALLRAVLAWLWAERQDWFWASTWGVLRPR